MARAWELSLLLSPHADENSKESISFLNLFKQIPGAFPDDEPELLKQTPTGLTPAQEAERQRRIALPRIQRPR